MRLLVLLGALAVTSAQHHQPYYGPQHVPVIQNGVPVEPPEVQAARAAHLAAFSGGAATHVAPYANAGQYAGNAHYNNPAPQQGRYTPPAYQTSHVQPAIGQNGQPLDTPEVEAAKAHHFAAYSQQHAALGQALSQSAPGGYAGHGGGHYRKKRSVYGGYGYAHGVPAIGPNGVPLDTPEVQHAKAAHFAAVAEATARAGHGGYAGYAGGYDGRYDGGYDGGYAGHGGYAPAYHGPIHIPVIGPNGVPVDTPEVQHARAAHLAALQGAGHGYGGPVDTPEVQHAKAAHFAAYAAAAHGHHGHY